MGNAVLCVDCCSVLSCHPDLAKASCKSLLGTANMANFALKAFFTPTPAGAAILVATLLAFRSTLVKASWSKLAILLLLYINRGNLPLRWHFKLTAIALRARFRWEFARLGLRKATSEQNKIGLKGGDLALGGVGKNVLEIVSTRRAVVGYAESDYNLHMSNSNYAQAVDFARMQFASDYAGTGQRRAHSGRRSAASRTGSKPKRTTRVNTSAESRSATTRLSRSSTDCTTRTGAHGSSWMLCTRGDSVSAERRLLKRRHPPDTLQLSPITLSLPHHSLSPSSQPVEDT